MECGLKKLRAPSAIRMRASDRKSTRLNSSHGYISYAVFCLKKKNKTAYLPLTHGAASVTARFSLAAFIPATCDTAFKAFLVTCIGRHNVSHIVFTLEC